MTREELVAYCRRAPDVGAVKHEEFVDYITLIERRRRVDNRWITEEAPYMSVDGRLAMANADHHRQDKKLIFHDPVVLSDTDEQLTLMVAVESEIYGRRHGIATSRRLGGSPIEQQHPWEIAETSAIGRALAAMGYGLLPGTGLASAEDMERAAARPAMGSRSRLSERQQAYLIDAVARARSLEQEDAIKALEAMCQERYGHTIAECTPDEGRELSLELKREEQARRAAA